MSAGASRARLLGPVRTDWGHERFQHQCPQPSDSRDDPGLTRLIYGAMPLGGSWSADDPLTEEQEEVGFAALDAAEEAGYRDLDLADIYAAGKSETVVGRWLAQDPQRRQRMKVQTKAGIRIPGGTAAGDAPMHYRLDAATVRGSLEESLTRLGLESVERFFIHRWDPLADLDELGAALDAIVDEDWPAVWRCRTCRGIACSCSSRP